MAGSAWSRSQTLAPVPGSSRSTSQASTWLRGGRRLRRGATSGRTTSTRGRCGSTPGRTGAEEAGLELGRWRCTSWALPAAPACAERGLEVGGGPGPASIQPHGLLIGEFEVFGESCVQIRRHATASVLGSRPVRIAAGLHHGTGWVRTAECRRRARRRGPAGARALGGVRIGRSWVVRVAVRLPPPTLAERSTGSALRSAPRAGPGRRGRRRRRRRCGAFGDDQSFSMPLSPQASAPGARDCRTVSRTTPGAEVGVVGVEVPDPADVRGLVEDPDERHRQPATRRSGRDVLEGVEDGHGQRGDQRPDRPDPSRLSG